MFTYKNESRGYYLHVSPVSRSVVSGVAMESYTAFTGTKLLLLACDRRSKKREGQAENIALDYRAMLIDRVLLENGLKLAQGAI